MGNYIIVVYLLWDTVGRYGIQKRNKRGCRSIQFAIDNRLFIMIDICIIPIHRYLSIRNINKLKYIRHYQLKDLAQNVGTTTVCYRPFWNFLKANFRNEFNKIKWSEHVFQCIFPKGYRKPTIKNLCQLCYRDNSYSLEQYFYVNRFRVLQEYLKCFFLNKILNPVTAKAIYKILCIQLSGVNTVNTIPVGVCQTWFHILFV